MLRLKKTVAATPAPTTTESTDVTTTTDAPDSGPKSDEGRHIRKRTFAETRIQKDIAELDPEFSSMIDFPNPNDLMNFIVTVRPDSGYWARGRYIFSFNIHSEHPFKPPRVLCQTKIYHPNIDLDGNVCLNILKEDWSSALDLERVIIGLLRILYEPNPDDPLNREAAELCRNDRNQFQRIVRRTMEGYSHAGVAFERFV